MRVKLLPIQAFSREEKAVGGTVVRQVGQEAGGPGGNRGRDRRALWTPQMKRWRKGMSGDQKPVCMRRKNAGLCKS
eukprot:1145912-Pelagomonas_calceolata.AAC.5